MTDKELLELAAKAAGITIKPVEIKNVEFAGDDRFIGYSTDPHEWLRGWFNPLTDDGDCGRLEAKLDINIEWWSDSVCCTVDSGSSWTELFADHEDKNAARRYASTALAAEIGKGLK